MKNIVKRFTAAVLALVLVLALCPVFAEENNGEYEEEIIIDVNYEELEFKYNSYVYTHHGCGGNILHRGDIFHNCVCDKCHEEHYLYSSFVVDVEVVPVYGPVC